MTTAIETNLFPQLNFLRLSDFEKKFIGIHFKPEESDKSESSESANDNGLRLFLGAIPLQEMDQTPAINGLSRARSNYQQRDIVTMAKGKNLVVLRFGPDFFS